MLIDVSGVKEPVLLLAESGLHESVLHRDVSGPKEPALLFYVCNVQELCCSKTCLVYRQGLVLFLDESVLRILCLSQTSLVYRGLCCS